MFRRRASCFVLFSVLAPIPLAVCSRCGRSPEIGERKGGTTYELVASWPESTKGWRFHYPYRIEINDSGFVHVFEMDSDRVKQFGPDGVLLKTLHLQVPERHSLSQPQGMTVDSKGNIYVVDRALECIFKLDERGAFREKWGSHGSHKGQFTYPGPIARDSKGCLYVADTGNNRVQKLDEDGRILRMWGSFGEENGQFDGPTDLAIDGQDRIHVADKGNCRVQKFTSDGRFLSSVGTRGKGDGQFEGLTAIDVDASGRLYAAEMGSNRIQVFDSSGAFMRELGLPRENGSLFNRPADLAAGPSGSLYVADCGNHRIQKFSGDGAFALSWGSAGADPDEFDSPARISIDGSGSVHVLDRGNSRIAKYTLDGVLVTPSVSTSGVSWQPELRDLTSDSSGTLYVAETTRVSRLDAHGRFHGTWGVDKLEGEELFVPTVITADPADSIYVATWDDTIGKFDKTGRLLTAWKLTRSDNGKPDGISKLRGVSGIPGGISGMAVDRSGYVYVVEKAFGRIQVFKPRQSG